MKLDDNGAAYFVEMVDSDEELEEIHPGLIFTHNFIQLKHVLQDWVRAKKLKSNTNHRIQSNLVTTNIKGPSIFVRHSLEFVITVKIYVVK